ncbi:MAG: hypothetical protein L0H53_12450 [Candidatus Nitrosocosmicus sp.]|nr:hypothetical protein [Candidatus Nitrosocosmicus sp.]MDN5868351.1 hypothetical protein [Candidatus Nitrosocosmicus sp.]
MRCSFVLRIQLTKTIKASKNHNDNDCGNDDINNKKIPDIPHKPVISLLGYKHNPPWESIVSLEDLKILKEIQSFRVLPIKHACIFN